MRSRFSALLLGAAVFGVLTPATARAQTRTDNNLVVAASSAVDFTVYVKALFTLKQRGEFKQFDGQIAYDPTNPSATHLNLTVYTASVDTHDTGHDEMLRSPEFFDVTEYPTMRFLSTSVTAGQNGNLVVGGDLTIRGVTRHVEVPVAVHRPGGQGTQFETTFDIDRTEFGLNGSASAGGFHLSVAKNVTIHLAIVAGRPGGMNLGR